MGVRAVGICLKPDQAQQGAFVRELADWLDARGIEAVLDAESAKATGGSGTLRSELGARVDLVVVLGGDGTLLAVVRALGERLVPILGVNLGTLGFLAEIAQDELYDTLEAVLADGLRRELRARIEVRVLRDGRERQRYLALNDAVVARTALSRIVDLDVAADGRLVTTYHADGLIVCTPTGSTAYSLSAGGPLLVPGVEALVLTPISPHTLTHRPLVVPDACELTVRVRDTRGGPVQLTVDGQVGCEIAEADRVELRRAAHPACFLVPADRNPFHVMREKLRWGAR